MSPGMRLRSLLMLMLLLRSSRLWLGLLLPRVALGLMEGL